jgi:hypothetical protein
MIRDKQLYFTGEVSSGSLGGEATSSFEKTLSAILMKMIKIRIK